MKGYVACLFGQIVFLVFCAHEVGAGNGEGAIAAFFAATAFGGGCVGCIIGCLVWNRKEKGGE